MFMKTQNDVDKYASEGLRTIYLAERYVDEDEFKEWFEKSR
jgi:magnesium-transporting ATPase (P-type)